jgi:hypothetical protein
MRKKTSTLVLMTVLALGHPATAQNTLTISIPGATAIAGEPFEVRIGGGSDGSGTVRLITAYGGTSRPFELTGGAAVIELSTDVAGTATVVAEVGPDTALAHVEVSPAADLRVESTTVAPERAHVGSGDLTVLAFVADRFGNPAPDQTPVDLAVRYPDGSVQTVEVGSGFGLAVGMLPVGGLEGTGEASAASGQTSAGAPIQVYPAEPVPFSFAATGSVPPADGRSRLTVTTGDLVDRLGNPIPEGTSVLVVVDHDDGRRDLIPAVVTARRLTISLLAPNRPDRVVVSAVLLGRRSDPLVIEFGLK